MEHVDVAIAARVAQAALTPGSRLNTAIRGQIIPPGQGIDLRVAPHPLKLSSECFTAPAGLTVAELVEFARTRVDTGIRTRFAVYLGGHVIPPDLWSKVRPKPGTYVLLRAVAEFGGDNTLLRNILTIAALGAAVFLAPVLAPILLPGIAGAAGIIGAAITVGGQLLINQLFPVASPTLSSNDAAKTIYSIGGGQNVADPFASVPSILGHNRYTPKLGALTYTETIGDDQYLRMLVVWGYGPLDISDIKIGETLLSNFADVEIETNQGYISDPALTLYPDEVIQTDLSVELTAAAGWQVRTTATTVDEISLDIVAPAGIVRVDSQGASQSYTVSIKAEYSPTGAGTWSPLGTLNLTGRSSDAIRQGLRLAVANGQYDVRVEKTSSDYTGSDTVQEEVLWTALRSFRNSAPVSFPKPLAVSALRIRATSQLNGTISDLNGIVQSHVANGYNGTAWVADVVSNNPADLFRHVLQGPANARPVADAGIDLDTLALWWAYCQSNGFAFNMVRDTAASVYDTLTDICAAGRAVQVFKDGKWSVVWDDPTTPIVQHFTPRNSWGFSGQRAYSPLPHGWRVRFINEAVGYQQDERIVYDDGYNSSNATLFEQIEFPGITNPDLIWRHGRFHIAQARLRPEVYTLNADIEHVVCTRGDRVRITHDVPEWGLGAGRVKSVSGQTLTLDEGVTMASGGHYSMRFRLADGSSLLRTVVTDDGLNFTIALDPGDSDQSVPAAGDLFLFGQLNAESVVLRVKGVTPAADLSAKITLVDDAPDISTADSGAIPAFDSQITVPIDPFTFPPVNLAIREVYAGVGGATASGVFLTWETVAGEFPKSYDTQFRDDDGDQVWRDNTSVDDPTKTAFFPDLQTGHWSFRVRAVFTDGSTSAWAELTGQSLLGLASVPLGDISNLRMTYVDATSALTWDEIDDFRTPRYEIRKGDSWEAGLVIGDVAHPPFVTYGDGNYWVAGIARPAPGIVTYSTNPMELAVAGSILVQNVIASYDEPGTGWTGTVSGPGTITGGLFQTTAAGTPACYEIPVGHYFDVGYSRPTRLNAIWKATGTPVSQNVLTDPDFLNNPDVLGSASARYVDSYVEVAVGTGSTDVYAAADVYSDADVYAGSPAFGSWTKFAPGVYVGSVFNFRLVLISEDATVTAVALTFTVSVDVPDRLDHVTNHTLSAGGETFTFTPDGSATATPFHGGPNGATVPNIQVTWAEQSGDYLDDYTSSISKSSVALQIKNAGVGVSRKINAIFQGW